MGTIVVMKDIYRRYPNQYEELVKLMHDAFTTEEDEDDEAAGGNKVDLNDLEPEAKAAMIWIIGEYAERIDDAELLLENTVFGDEETTKKERQRMFNEAPVKVRMELLIASVKTFLKAAETNDPDENPAQELCCEVIEFADHSNDPDLRMRSFVYWRLLAVDPAAAKQVVLAERPEVSTDSEAIEPALLDRLMGYVSTMAAVYQCPPEQLEHAEGGEEPEDEEIEEVEDDGEQATQYIESPRVAAPPEEEYDDDEDEEDEEEESDETPVGDSGPAPDLMPQSGTDSLEDMFAGDLLGERPAGGSSGSGGQLTPPGGMSSVFKTPVVEVKAKAESSQGFQGEGTYLWLEFKNTRATPINSLDLRFNKNTFGLVKTAVSYDNKSAAAEGGALLHPGVPGMPLMPQSSIICVYRMNTSSAAIQMTNPLLDIQAAIKMDGVDSHGYFSVSCPLEAVLSLEPCLEKRAYMQMWKEAKQEQDFILNVQMTCEQVVAKLEASHFLNVHQRDSDDGVVLYTCAVTDSACAAWCLATLTIGASSINVKVKCEKPMIEPFTQDMFTRLFGAAPAPSTSDGLEGLF